MSYTVKREVITGIKIVKTEIKKLEDWKNIEFESSSSKTPEFVAFARMFRARIKKEADAKGLTLASWSNGHFGCSAFFKSLTSGKIVYLSISDVRFFRNSWATDILIRTAKHEKDYTGGANCSANLQNIGEQLAQLTK